MCYLLEYSKFVQLPHRVTLFRYNSQNVIHYFPKHRQMTGVFNKDAVSSVKQEPTSM
jgi:hypothetical protein